MNELKHFIVWNFSASCPIPDDVSNMLLEGEVANHAYKTIRDVAIFTNKRLIVRDAQGISGKKVEIYCLPYSAINMWSTENSGKLFDTNSEVELWTRAGSIKINLKKDIDIREFDRILASAILG